MFRSLIARFRPCSSRSLVTRRYLSSPSDPVNGRDFKHWLIIMDFEKGETQKEMIQTYISTLADAVCEGDRTLAQKKIYSVCTDRYTGFGALIEDEADVEKITDSCGVQWVLADTYLDWEKKDYGGDLLDSEGNVIVRPEYTQNTIPRPRNPIIIRRNLD